MSGDANNARLDWTEVKEAFADLMDTPRDQRLGRLRDMELEEPVERAVRRLLGSHARAGDLLADPGSTPAPPDSGPRAPSRE